MNKWMTAGLAVFVLAGCAEPVPETRRSAVSGDFTEAVAVVDERWLAVVPDEEPCPTLKGWVRIVRSPAALARFCEYQRTAGAAAFPGRRFERADRIEGRVIAQTGSAPTTALETAMGPWLALLFEHQADIPVAPALIPASPNTRLAIVDSLSTGSTISQSMHGLGMDDFARSIGCVQASCAFEISHHLALPRGQGGAENTTRGGFYGTRWDLARAIVDAVDATPLTQNLVINLSVAWLPEAGDVLPSNHLAMIRQSESSVAAGSRAVHAALVHARCRGALVFAASGNDDEGLRTATGPMLPAAWATVPVTGLLPCGTTTTEPLVHAVGGIDSEDGPLENARVGSTPRLVAPASGSAVETSAVFTGTSVSTIVASSAAAMVWTIQPSISSAGVVGILDSTARATPFAADFCATPPCGPARAISVCLAQADACEGVGACATLDCSSALPRPYPRPLELFVYGSGVLQTVTGLVHTSTPSQVCGLDTYVLAGDPPPPSCARVGNKAVRHLDVGPQPHRGSCPACGGGGGGLNLLPGPTQMWFLVEVSNAGPGVLEDPFLVLHDSSGQAFARYALPTPLDGGASIGFTFDVWESWRADSLWLEYETVTPGAGRLFHAEPLLTP